jgi:hypothetical protein
LGGRQGLEIAAITCYAFADFDGAGLKTAQALAKQNNAIGCNLLFPVLSWLLLLAASHCYSAAPVVGKSRYPRPKLVCSLFFTAFISDISQRQESPQSR